jgi:F5/8 type C domain-containing protein
MYPARERAVERDKTGGHRSSIHVIPDSAQTDGIAALPPQSITLDLGGTYNVTGLTYLPGQDGILHGTITACSVYASTDGTAFTRVSSGTWADDASQKTATFTAASAHCIRCWWYERCHGLG